MVNVSVRMTGFVEALSAVRAIGEAGRAVNGQLATFGSPLSYAMPVEKRWRRGSGGARMFERGVAETAALAPAILGPAILRGPAAVGQAKRKIRDIGLERIRALTPVRSGRLRASVSELNRPGIG